MCPEGATGMIAIGGRTAEDPSRRSRHPPRGEEEGGLSHALRMGPGEWVRRPGSRCVGSVIVVTLLISGLINGGGLVVLCRREGDVGKRRNGLRSGLGRPRLASDWARASSGRTGLKPRPWSRLACQGLAGWLSLAGLAPRASFGDGGALSVVMPARRRRMRLVPVGAARAMASRGLRFGDGVARLGGLGLG